MTPIIYVCHPFGGDQNKLDKAEAWAASLSRRFDALFVVPWVPLCRWWPNSGESLQRGLELDLAAIDRCDGLIAVGGMMSENGRREFGRAKKALDMSNIPMDALFNGERCSAHITGWLSRIVKGMSKP